MTKKRANAGKSSDMPEDANAGKSSEIPEDVKSFEIGIDVGSTRTRAYIRGLDHEEPENPKAEVVYSPDPVIISSEVGIVPRDDMAAKMAITASADSLKRTYKSLTVIGDDIDAFRDSLEVAYPTKSGQIPENSMTALERLIDDLTSPWVKEGKPILIAVGVPTEFANEYKETIEQSILPRAINRNGCDANPYLLSAEAFFESCAIREHAKGVSIDGEKIDLRKPCIVSIGGATTNIYIADTKNPSKRNSVVLAYGGRALAASLRDKLLDKHSDATMDMAHAEKLVSGNLDAEHKKKYKSVKAKLSGFKKDPVPEMAAPISVKGRYRGRNIGPEMDEAARELFNSTYQGLVKLLVDYESSVKPTVFIMTGRAGQIEGFDTALQEGLRLNFPGVHVYNLGQFQKDGKNIFNPELLVAQGSLSAINFARHDPDHDWDYLTAEK